MMVCISLIAGLAADVAHEPATAFLLELIARLQGVATVPMIDVRAYERWLDS
jgi:hypothetical protein